LVVVIAYKRAPQIGIGEDGAVLVAALAMAG
jgi:hypothetical protein